MPEDTAERERLCAEVEMTPTQCNEVIEDKLSNLLPAYQRTLNVMQRVDDMLANGRIEWRKALQLAKERVESDA